MIHRKLGSLKKNSLMVKLMISFMTVIILLVSFNFFSFYYLKDKIHKEIIKYNELNISHTVDGYEKHLRLTRDSVLSLTQNSRWLADLNVLRQVKANKGYDRIKDVETEINVLIGNPFLFFENLILHFAEDRYVLEKEGTSSTEDMFSRYYYSEAYDADFWISLFDKRLYYEVLPAAAFYEKTATYTTPKGRLLPLLIKLFPYQDMYFVVMLDADRLLKTYHYSTEVDFYILDTEGREIYASSPDIAIEPVVATEKTGYSVKHRDNYYFYKKGAETGFTYVSIAPTKSISAELLRLNLILISLLVAAIVISLFFSLLFAMRLNQPIKQILDFVQHRHSDDHSRSRVYEFDLIRENLRHMHKQQENISQDLDRKKGLLRSYAYANRLKNIYTSFTESVDFTQSDKPFVLFLFRITWKKPFADLHLEEEKAAYVIKECIDFHWQRDHKGSVTLQVERDLILSIVFQPASEDRMSHTLERLKQMLDVDAELYFLTIAVSSMYTDSGDFQIAYEEAAGKLRQRKLGGETQLIRHLETRGASGSQLTVLQVEELHTRLLSGEEDAVHAWLAKRFESMNKGGAAIEEYHSLTKEIHDEVEKLLKKLNLHHRLQTERPTIDQVETFYTLEQYRTWFYRLFDPVLTEVKRMTTDVDPVIRFIHQYLDQHLSEDITLDLMADKLNLTPGYLSTYFKEKTGTNFSDMLNTRRIQTAKELLVGLDMKIQDVAGKVGYQNVNSFIRMFKRYSGITPGEYRKKYASHE